MTKLRTILGRDGRPLAGAAHPDYWSDERRRARQAGRELRARDEAERARDEALAFERPLRVIPVVTPKRPMSKMVRRVQRTRCVAAPPQRSTRGGVARCDERTVDARPLWRHALGAVVAVVANAYEVPPMALWRGGRKKPLPTARGVIWYLLRERYNMPLVEIGRVFGRHHTTVLHGVQKVEAAVEHIGPTARTVEQIVYELDGEA